MLIRYNFAAIQKDIQGKMVFIAGPRQCGKTTLSKSLYPHNHEYLDFDSIQDRKIIIRQEWNQHQKLIILDELHKMKTWKRWIKGVWDTNDQKHYFLVTGSAR